MNSSTASDHYLRLSSKRGILAFGTAQLSAALPHFHTNALNAALLPMGRDLHITASAVQWIVSSYVLTIAATVLFAGGLGDRFDRRFLMVGGALMFGMGSCVSAVSSVVVVVIAGRVLQGLGGALLMTTSLATVQASFHPSLRARVIGIWASLGGIAGTLAPVCGGLLADSFGWRAVFWVNVPAALVVCVLAPQTLPRRRSTPGVVRVDIAGMVLSIAAMVGLTYALLQLKNQATHPEAFVYVAAVGGALAFGAFLVSQSRNASAMLPLGMFRSRLLSAGSVAMLFVYMTLGAITFLVPIETQARRGLSATAAGAMMIPIPIAMLSLSTVVGILVTRFGPRIPIVCGLVSSCVGCVLLAHPDGATALGVDIVGLILFGAGIAFSTVPLTTTIMHAVGQYRAGIGSGLNNVLTRVGQLAGVVCLPLLAGLAGQTSLSGHLAGTHFARAFIAAAALLAVGALLAWFGIPTASVVGESGDRDGERRAPEHRAAG